MAKKKTAAKAASKAKVAEPSFGEFGEPYSGGPFPETVTLIMKEGSMKSVATYKIQRIERVNEDSA